jgi:hypothetical protein
MWQRIGTVLLIAPFVVLGWAWVEFVAARSSMTIRHRTFGLCALVLTTVAMVGFCLVPNTFATASFHFYEAAGKVGMSLSVLSILFASGTSGRLRIIASVAGLGAMGLWSTLGFYPFMF